MTNSDCIFCKISRGEIPALKVYEDEDTLAFLDIHPINPGHTLVIPKKHFADIHEIPNEDLAMLMAKVKKLATAIKESLEADGINIGINNGKAAGQIIFHTHVHIIPRYSTDGLKNWGHHDTAEKKQQAIAEKIKKSL